MVYDIYYICGLLNVKNLVLETFIQEQWQDLI